MTAKDSMDHYAEKIRQSEEPAAIGFLKSGCFEHFFPYAFKFFIQRDNKTSSPSESERLIGDFLEEYTSTQPPSIKGAFLMFYMQAAVATRVMFFTS